MLLNNPCYEDNSRVTAAPTNSPKPIKQPNETKQPNYTAEITAQPTATKRPNGLGGSQMCIRDSLKTPYRFFVRRRPPSSRALHLIGIKQLMAGGGVVLIGTTLVPLLSGLFG